MAEKRLVVSPIDTSQSIVQPVARTVETYTRPVADTKQSGLASFLQGITPALKTQAKIQQQEIAERNNAIKSGILSRQAQEARVATYDLLKAAGNKFDENSEAYLEAGADLVTTDREAFFSNHFQKMQDAGIDPAVIDSVKRDVAYGNLKFFQEGYLPAKQQHEDNKSLDVLSKDLIITANATNLTPEAALKEIQDKTKQFVDSHPTIGFTKVNDLVRKTEATLASTLAEDGLPRGKTALSNWLVENKQTTTKSDLSSWATITNSQVRREVGTKKAVAAKLSNNIKTQAPLIIDIAMAEIKGNSELYYKNPEALQDFKDKTIEEAVTQFAETNNEQAVAEYRQALNNRFVSEFAKKHLANIIDTQQAEVINTGVTASFTQSTPEATIQYLDEFVKETKVDKESLIQQLLNTQDDRTEEIGAGPTNGVMAWLNKEGALVNAKYSDKVASIAKKNEKFVVNNQKKAFVESVIKQDVDNNVLMNTSGPITFTASDGKTYTFTLKDQTTAFESMFPSLSKEEKLAKWYAPRGIVPPVSKGIVASGSRFFMKEPTSTQDMLIAGEALSEIQKLTAAGIPLSKVLTSEEARKRYEVVKFYTESIDEPRTIELKDAEGTVQLGEDGEPILVKDISSALRAASGARFDLTVSATDLTTAIESEISEISPFSVDLSEIRNPEIVITDLRANITTLVQAGIPLADAVPFATKKYAEDNPIIQDGMGFNTTIRIYNTDVSKVPNAVQNLQDLGEELTQSKEWKDTFKGLSDHGIRWKNNLLNPDMLDIQIVNESGRPILNLVSVGATDAMNNTDRIKRLASERILDAGINASSMIVDITQEDIDAMVAAQKALFEPQ